MAVPVIITSRNVRTPRNGSDANSGADMQTHADDGVWTEMVESVTLAKFRLEEAWKVQLKTVRLQGYKATRRLDLGSASDTCTIPHPEITPITAGSSEYLGINTHSRWTGLHSDSRWLRCAPYWRFLLNVYCQVLHLTTHPCIDHGIGVLPLSYST
jgi:hypothetical protein